MGQSVAVEPHSPPNLPLEGRGAVPTSGIEPSAFILHLSRLPPALPFPAAERLPTAHGCAPERRESLRVIPTPAVRQGRQARFPTRSQDYAATVHSRCDGWGCLGSARRTAPRSTKTSQ